MANHKEYVKCWKFLMKHVDMSINLQEEGVVLQYI